MFYDSKYADIKCGRTKAEYVITYAVAPCFREELCENVGLSTKNGIHLDESTYNDKVRFELHLSFLGESRQRTTRFLRTVQLEPEIDVEIDFLLNKNEKSINDLKMERWNHQT